MRQDETNSNDREASARSALMRVTPCKWRLIRVFEALARFFLRLMPWEQTIKSFDARPDRILVLEYWNFGDLAILVPFLRTLRQGFPQARISLLVKPSLTSFLDGQGLVDEFIPPPVPWPQHFNRWLKYNPFSFDCISLLRTILAVRKRRFDWAFSGRMDVRDNFMLWLSGARRRIGYGIGGGGCFLTDQVKPDLSRPHRTDLWLQLLEAVSQSPNTERASFLLRDADSVFAHAFFKVRGIPYEEFLIGIHPGARITTRKWGKNRFAEVARRLVEETEAHVLWFSDPDDPCEAPPLERCHTVSLSLRLFLAVLSRCRVLVCNDSGPMHFANLLNVPVVAVFGATNPVWFGPRGPDDRVVIHPEFSCRPCFDYCIFDQPHCLRAISVDEVHAAITETLSQSKFIFRSKASTHLQ